MPDLCDTRGSEEGKTKKSRSREPRAAVAAKPRLLSWKIPCMSASRRHDGAGNGTEVVECGQWFHLGGM